MKLLGKAVTFLLASLFLLWIIGRVHEGFDKSPKATAQDQPSMGIDCARFQQPGGCVQGIAMRSGKVIAEGSLCGVDNEHLQKLRMLALIGMVAVGSTEAERQAGGPTFEAAGKDALRTSSLKPSSPACKGVLLRLTEVENDLNRR